jgi:type I restriction enzyme S subunit
MLATIGEVTEAGVDQAPPEGDGEFVYIDIASIDNRLKRIVSAKTLPVAGAPSRARQRLKTDDVLISMTRPNLNAVAILPSEFEGAIGSTGFHVLRTRWIDPHWLLYFVQTDDFIDAMTRLVQGVLYPAIRPKDVRSHVIPVAPLAEQRRVVAEIEKQFTRLEAGVVALNRVRANLKRYRAAVLKAAIEGRLVPTEAELACREGRAYEPASELLKRILAERRRHPEEEQPRKFEGKRQRPPKDWKPKYEGPVSPDTTTLPRLPEGWCWVTLAYVAPSAPGGVKTGPFGSLLKKKEHQTSGVPVYGIENIDRMRFIRGSRIHISPDKAMELAEYDAKPGDVLISRSGTVGKVCVVPRDSGVALISTNLIRVRLNTAAMSPRFFCLLFNGSPAVLTQISSLCKGSTRSFLNNNILASLRFPLPPVAEQQAIVEAVEEQLSVIDELETQVEANLKRAERLRQAVLKRAFEGKLVPQDPNEEPASVLLERIRHAKSRETVAGTLKRIAPAPGGKRRPKV